MPKYEIRILNQGVHYIPVLEGEVKLSTERQGTPGKLTFSVVKDVIINFQEGNEVSFYVDDSPVFFGYVFEKERSKSETIDVTAYDQLRYFKNKDVYMFENKKASEFLKMLAGDFKLKVGEVDDTEYIIPAFLEDNSTLFDMMQTALDETLTHTKKLYVLYDDFGKLTLKNINEMRLNILVDGETLEDFDYSTSIDTNTFNKIKLVYDNTDTGKREVYETLSSENINRWGMLQYFEKANSNKGLIAKADALLSLYNRKTRRLSLKNVYGDIRVRGGSGIAISLNLGDVKVYQYFLCERVTHTFKSDMHLMDIVLKGSDFIE